MKAKFTETGFLHLEPENIIEVANLKKWVNENKKANGYVSGTMIKWLSVDSPEELTFSPEQQIIEQRKFCIELAAKCNHGMNPDGVANHAEKYFQFLNGR